MEEIQEVEMQQEIDQREMVSLDILNHVKMNVKPESMFDGTKSDLSFSRKELKTAHVKLKQAFVEFHRKLRLLKSYS